MYVVYSLLCVSRSIVVEVAATILVPFYIFRSDSFLLEASGGRWRRKKNGSAWQDFSSLLASSPLFGLPFQRFSISLELVVLLGGYVPSRDVFLQKVFEPPISFFFSSGHHAGSSLALFESFSSAVRSPSVWITLGSLSSYMLCFFCSSRSSLYRVLTPSIIFCTSSTSE